MRLMSLLIFALAASVSAFESPTPAFPLWDGHESVADYAKRVNLPPTQTLDLGDGVKLDLVLIPAGKFIMGTPEPTPVDEAGFQKTIFTGQALLAASAFALLVMLAVVAVRAIRQKRRPQLSLGLLLMVTIAAGGGVLSGLHWRRAVQALEVGKAEFAAAKARYDNSSFVEKPGHSVTISKPFYVGKFEVTQAQYQAVFGNNPATRKGPSNPVETVSWDDAQEFCAKTRIKLGRTVRLLSEAEWEFACRAGTRNAYYSGDASVDLDRVAWYDKNSNFMHHPAGQKDPNDFGLYDMHGNVWEWCLDEYKDDYAKPTTEDTEASEKSVDHVLRGGSSWNMPEACRAAFRMGFPKRNNVVGFRVAVVPAETP